MRGGYKFCDIYEMCITNNKRYMTYQYYLKQTMQKCDLKLNLIIDENLHLIKALDRVINLPLLRNYAILFFQFYSLKGP